MIIFISILVYIIFHTLCIGISYSILNKTLPVKINRWGYDQNENIRQTLKVFSVFVPHLITLGIWSFHKAETWNPKFKSMEDRLTKLELHNHELEKCFRE